ncbi:MAG: HAD hydrolase family protein [Pseudomonadales bacterium]|nr:HAD hydrolase family protein [Pseudomonadales bacterium]
MNRRVTTTSVPDEFLRRLRNVRLLGLDVDGVMTDGRLYYGPNSAEFKAFHALDGSAMKRLMAAGVPIAIVTGRTSEAVARRASELGVPYLYAGVADKLAALDELAARSGVDVNAMAFVGDDLADLVVFGHVGVAIGVPNAHPDLIHQADYVTSVAGGFGAVREICDLVISARSIRR